MNKEIKKNNKGYQVLTDTGWKDFAGVAYMGNKRTVKIYLEDNKWIQCSLNHRFFDLDLDERYAKTIVAGDLLYGLKGPVKVQKVELCNSEDLYDLVDVEGHRYFANGILSHNCEFITEDETLINPFILKSLKGEEPYHTTGRVRWYSPLEPNKMYIVGLDPCMGTGGDNAAITVWQLPEFRQVAEWMHNKTDIKGQIRVLLEILNYIHLELKNNPEQNGTPEIYWSVENNSIGEAALQVIEETGEDLFPGDFVSEPRKKRKGFTTTHKTKIEACSRLKTLVESHKIELKSKTIVREIKSFVKSNRSYAAKVGEKDDLISSLLLCVRMINEIQTWDSDVYDRLAQVISLEDEEYEPLPLIIS